MNEIVSGKQHPAPLNKFCFICVLLILVLPGKSIAQKQGKALIDSLLQVLPRAKEDTNTVQILNKLGSLYSSIKPDEGINFGLSGLALATKLNWEDGIAAAYNILGICYVYKSDYSKSLNYWDTALKIFEQQHNKKGILKIIGNIGVVYESQGNYSSALENNLLALKSAEEIGDKISIGINLGNIGADYEYLKDYKKALDYDLKALKIEEELGDTQKTANFLCNIGNNYIDQQNYTQALQFQLKALKYDMYLGNNEGIARDMGSVGFIYKEDNKIDSALGYLFYSLELSKKSGIKVTESKALSFIGEVLMAIDRAKDFLPDSAANGLLEKYHISLNKRSLLLSAIEYLDKSIALDLETTDLNELQHNYYLLSEADAVAGDFKNALESYKKYTIFKDSVFSTDNNIKITNLETKRELALKDKQIQIDKLEVAGKRKERVFFMSGIGLLLVVITIVIRNIKLAAARELSENKLSAFQARMSPHFIFNSLNSIQYLVLNKETELSVDYLAEFSSLMRKILDNSAKSKVLLKTEIEMLRSYIQLEHLRFDYFTWAISVAANVPEEHIEIPGMIIQPFVENAILHGIAPKGEKGILNIIIERDNKHIICTVEDNGIGRKKSFELNINKNKGHQSHGVDIAANRLALLNDRKKGIINKVTYIDKEENGTATGTKVIIEIPIL